MRPLATTGIGGDGAATAFEAAAGEALPTDPALAARLYAAAVTAGRPGIDVGAKRAEALALAGDLDGALRLADEVLATEQAPRQKVAAAVAAAALAHRGQLGRSAQLYRWAGVPHLAAIGAIGTGEPADHQESTGPPTSLSSAIDLMARGLRESVRGAPTTALSMLVRAAGTLEPVGRGVLLPDSPAALGAILALHHGELTTATSLLERAIAAGTGGALLATRHRLLLAWIAMVRGHLTEAAKMLGTTRPTEPRDLLFAVAIEVGIARRAGDAAALGRAWQRAGEAVLRHPVDLFTFLPLGELTMAAARLRDPGRLATTSTRPARCSPGSATRRCGRPRCGGAACTRRSSPTSARPPASTPSRCTRRPHATSASAPWPRPRAAGSTSSTAPSTRTRSRTPRAACTARGSPGTPPGWPAARRRRRPTGPPWSGCSTAPGWCRASRSPPAECPHRTFRPRRRPPSRCRPRSA